MIYDENGLLKKDSCDLISENLAPVTRAKKKDSKYSFPNKLYRRNITLSEEQFWRLDFIKKKLNKNRKSDEAMATLDKIMFDMIQSCLDERYPETKGMFEKFVALKTNQENSCLFD